MDKWQQILNQHDAKFNAFTTVDVKKTSFVAPLSHLGLIALTGDDAAHFLHNQLTNDVEHLGDAEARLAGYCSPKGRLLATMLMWKSGESIQLQLPHEIIPAIQKRLQMYVMRAKVKLADVSDQHVIFGLAGLDASTALSKWFATLPPTPHSTTTGEAGTLIRIADVLNAPRYVWTTTRELAASAWDQLSQDIEAADGRAWRLTEILSGTPHITLATQEKFVPQMINFEVIGGVNFKKGCYPGQEIVARSQYLGKLKRRMMLASIATQSACAGMDVFSVEDPEQPCGMIVNAERSATDEMLCLVELKTATIDAGAITMGAPDGPILKFHPLPYALPDAAQ